MYIKKEIVLTLEDQSCFDKLQSIVQEVCNILDEHNTYLDCSGCPCEKFCNTNSIKEFFVTMKEQKGSTVEIQEDE